MEKHGETLLGSYVYTRIMLLFRIRHEALQAWLPAPWEEAPFPAGSSKSANLAVGFCDVLRIQDAAGSQASSPSNRYIPFNGPARNPVTGELVNMWYRAFAVHPEALLGWGQAQHTPALPGSFSSTQIIDASGLETNVTERFEIRPAGGGLIELEIQYARGIPTPYAWQRNIRCPTDPSFGLHYRNVELRDEVKSVTEGIDRVRRYSFRVTVPQLEDLFDGTEELVAITSVPWSERHVFRV